MSSRRRFPVGAELLDGVGVHLRVWAPKRKRVEVVCRGEFEGSALLEAGPDGYFEGEIPRLRPGGRYGFRLDGEGKVLPDPASRFQPEGPHGLSEVVDPRHFAWSDRDWRGISPRGQVAYELHIGTFTPEGTYAAATGRLETLRDLGVTVLELMPLAEFPGQFGWGYDGVNLWAPSRLYGRPDDLRRFVDTAHGLGIAVLLDVVYNHLGPDGNFLKAFSPDYFTDRHKTEWGEALNFDSEDSGPVREFFSENAAYWVDEFHFDGLRLDATQAIMDSSPDHVVALVGRRAREAGAGRGVYVVAENEHQEARLVRGKADDGLGLDALWNDDFHHTAFVALTGRREAYYTDYLGTPQELLSAIRWGYLYQGQRYDWQKKRRGTPALDLAAENFVVYLENHDQVANSARGERLATVASRARLRAMTALLLLAPATPMLFQGQEFGSTRPFYYFADHQGDLAKAVTGGRREFLSQFPSAASMRDLLVDPCQKSTFEACKLDWSEKDTHQATWLLHRDLLALRREDAAFRQQRVDRVHGAVLTNEALALRFVCPAGDRLLLVNLGREVRFVPAPEPLLAAPPARRWMVLWSSEDPRYGGSGTPPIETDEGFCLPANAATVLAPEALPQ